MEGLWYLGRAERPYQRPIGVLLNVQFDALVARFFCLRYALGAFVFALRPAFAAISWMLALRAGAMYGFFCFSPPNLTDLAVAGGNTTLIVALDIAWRTFMSATVCTLSYLAARRFV